jgi:hypothetical protein
MSKRRALRVIPAYDPANNVGAVDRVRFCLINGRMADLTKDELDQIERWRQIDAWIRLKRYKTLNDEGKEVEAAVHGHAQIRNLVMSYFTVTWDTAERDIANTKNFCNVTHDDQEFYKSVYIEEYERMADMAKMSGKFAAAERLLFRASELRGHYDDVQEEIPNDKIEAFQLLIDYNPEAVGLRTVPDKEAHFERWRKKKKSISDTLSRTAEDIEEE